jgi:hypothetical protein
MKVTSWQFDQLTKLYNVNVQFTVSAEFLEDVADYPMYNSLDLKEEVIKVLGKAMWEALENKIREERPF